LIHNLCRDSEIDDLFLQPVRVDGKSSCRHFHLLFILCEGSDCKAEHIEVWNNDLTEGYVDECRQEDGQVGGDEVDHEDLLRHGFVESSLGFVVLEMSQLGRELREKIDQDRHDRGEDSRWQEDLYIVSFNPIKNV
jgi:hypothetical protein